MRSEPRAQAGEGSVGQPRLFGALIYFFFLLSGVSALTYQVIWVRQFGNIFGNTVHSAALVTAVFMLGLGLGSWVAGAWADRRYQRGPNSLLSAYAWLELAIALMAWVLSLLLPRLESISAALSSYVVDGDGWHSLSVTSLLSRYVLAAALTLPITMAMGATLTVLIRHLVRRDLSTAGLTVGALYGINTAGAALGAFLVDFALIPRLGLSATQSCAVMINAAVGLGALWLVRRRTPARLMRAEESEGAALAKPAEASARRLLGFTGVAIFLTGVAGLGLEILWFRFLITALGSYRATFSLLLTVILVGIWIGSSLGGALVHRFGEPVRLYVSVQCLFVIGTLSLLFLYQPSIADKSDLVQPWLAAPALLRPLVEVWRPLRVILVVVGVPALLMGFAYPVANAHVQRTESAVGARAGFLYLANTVGAVTGALATGFVLLPLLGVQRSVTVLAACALVSLVPLRWSSLGARERAVDWRRRAVPFALTVVAVGSLGAWVSLPRGFLLQRNLPVRSSSERVLAVREGINETLWVTETAGAGDRILYTNGHPMSGTNFTSQRYMRAFAHVPLLQSSQPESVLVICFGVGNTLHAASLHSSLKRLEVVDLSRQMVQQAPYFERWNRDVLADPRVSVFINDGRQHLRMQPSESYDLITLEPPPINQAGVAALYSTEFYELARQRLKSGGFVTQWLPAHQVSGPACAAAVRAFIDVFPDSIMISGYGVQFILVGRKDLPPRIDPGDLMARLAREPAVAEDLRGIDMGTLMEIVGSYAASPRSMANTAKDVSPVTDDFPVLEHDLIAFLDTEIPESLFDVTGAIQWCPDCFSGEGPRPELAGFEAYLRSMANYYRSPGLRFTNPQGARPPSHAVLPVDPAEYAEAWHRSRFMQRLFPPPEGDRPAGR